MPDSSLIESYPTPDDILDNLLTLKAGERVRVSVPWMKNRHGDDPLIYEIPLPPHWKIWVVKAVKWPTDDKGMIDKEALKRGEGIEEVWVPLTAQRLRTLDPQHKEFPLHKHDLLIFCTDTHYQCWNFVPCRENLLLKVAHKVNDNENHPLWPVVSLLDQTSRGMRNPGKASVKRWAQVMMSLPSSDGVDPDVKRVHNLTDSRLGGAHSLTTFLRSLPDPEPTRFVPEWVSKIESTWRQHLGDPNRLQWLTGYEGGDPKPELRYFEYMWYMLLTGGPYPGFGPEMTLVTDASVYELLHLTERACKDPVSSGQKDGHGVPKCDELVSVSARSTTEKAGARSIYLMDSFLTLLENLACVKDGRRTLLSHDDVEKRHLGFLDTDRDALLSIPLVRVKCRGSWYKECSTCHGGAGIENGPVRWAAALEKLGLTEKQVSELIQTHKSRAYLASWAPGATYDYVRALPNYTNDIDTLVTDLLKD